MITIPFANNLRDFTSNVDVVISDIWGVIHNGVESFPEAVDALRHYRQQGGTVVLLTNAPRPADSVQRQLRHLNVPDDAYDDIVSSGDLTRNYVASRPGQAVLHIGPERDNPVYDGLDVAFTTIEKADYMVCTGLFDDEVETGEHYRETMLAARDRKLTMICANPDIVVERGDRLIYCAGAIAELYRDLGGDVIFYGKPHRPAYDRAIELAARHRGGATPLDRMLAIGDSVRTDLLGANGMGLRCIFVARGIHSAEFADLHDIDLVTSNRLFGDAKPPAAVMRELKW